MHWLWAPLTLCLVMTGLLGYLGLHIIRRKVIFVDLALAQIAALGTIYAVYLGYDLEKPEDAAFVYAFSLGATFLGAALFSLARMRRERIPQEAFIGIVYAASSGVAILLLSRSTGEGEHLKSMLVGNILLVTWPQVLKTAAVYAGVGALHWIWRRPFFLLSEDPQGAEARGMRIRLWDFVFYATFGVVITTAVSKAGVLLVFCYLVVPAVCAMLISERLGAQLGLAWLVGLLCSAAGMFLSYHGDFPTGPSVVAAFAALLSTLACVMYVIRSERPRRSALRVAVGAVVAALVVAIPLQAKKSPESLHGAHAERLEQALFSTEEVTQIEAIHHLAETRAPGAAESLGQLLDRTQSDRVAEHLAHALATLGESSAVGPLQRALGRTKDDYVKIEIAQALQALGDDQGRRILEEIARSSALPLARAKAAQALRGGASDPPPAR
ncbi:MAG: metal ABC transporter permease [Nitrospirae bacterium]|nr:metal ABC transporter permease [Nitrospirota bacterium]